ncbi:MAG: hypothetical protein JW812_00135 [Alphaproteobacteria bacterium]|nr:hypothetical protein [Alphaproteobacteria bacterium]MBN2779765.1 hypothetical protein [Alphaproteobacteria bacterium]
MLPTLFYTLMTFGLLGLSIILLDIEKLSFRFLKTITTLFLGVGFLGAIWLSNPQMATLITAVVAVVLGAYVAVARPGLLSTRAVKGGISIAIFFLTFVLIESPSSYLLPHGGHLTFFEKGLFVLLAVHSMIAFVGSFPVRQFGHFKFPLPYHLLYGLRFMILSVAALFISTESPTGLILIGLGTLMTVLFIRLGLIAKKTEVPLYEKTTHLAFALQFVWIALLLDYTPLFIIAGVMLMLFLPEKKDWPAIRDTFLFPSLKQPKKID